MDSSYRVELLERTVVILADHFCCDPDFTPNEQSATREQLIRLAKQQAIREMEIWREKMQRIKDAR